MQNDFYKLSYGNRLTKKQKVICYEHCLITICKNLTLTLYETIEIQQQSK